LQTGTMKTRKEAYFYNIFPRAKEPNLIFLENKTKSY
jgi:hypothetical protein